MTEQLKGKDDEDKEKENIDEILLLLIFFSPQICHYDYC
jgi:hypothetical protein